MRKRDLAILLLAVFAVFFSLQHEGTFSFREAWYHPNDGATPITHETERLPAPIVADLNGDGRSEVLIATHAATIEVIEPQPSFRDESFRDARLLGEVSLLPDKVRVAAGRRPVAMATGFLEPYLPGMKTRRKQILVVVTAGWSILCFDHNLKLLWENSVQDDFPHGAHHKEVSILISNYSMRHGDVGAVIVGGSMEVQPQALLDPFEEEEAIEADLEKHRHTASKSEDLEDVSKRGGGGKERHFSYYTYAGKSGLLRWKHESQDFHRDVTALSQQLLPQHNYKLDAAALNNRHYGEVACRDYRESVLGALPHRWERRGDTRFELAHFHKHRRRHHKLQGKQHPHGKLVPGKDANNKVAHALGKALDLAMKSSKRIDRFSHGENYNSWWAPNAIVAHLQEGIEAVHLYTGRTICKLHLTAGGLHADVNGDGVLDHIQASGANGADQLYFAESGEARPCWAVAMSGVPVREQLFNGSICRHQQHTLQAEFASRAFGSAGENQGPIEVATPILLPRKDRHRHRRGSHGDVIFLTSLGEVTAYTAGALHPKDSSHHGRMRWQVRTGAGWGTHTPLPSGMASHEVVPTLAAMPLRAAGPPEVILAAGDAEAFILSAGGRREASIYLPVGPTEPIIIADFNNDRLNDLIVVTPAGIYGYVQRRQPGALLLSALLGCLIVAMAAIFVTQHLGQGSSKPQRGRSTD